MANNTIVTAISLLVNRVKVAEATGGSMKINPGITRVPCNDSIAFTLGKTVTDISVKCVVPRAGMRARLMEAVVGKQDIRMQFAMDSKFYDVMGKLSEGGVDWEVANGTLDGNWSFLGGEPTIA